MSKKNVIRIVIGVASVVILCLSVIFILKMRKSENIKFGMTKENVMSILKKGKYRHKYTKSVEEVGGNAKTIIKIKEGSLKNIKGEVIIRIDENSNLVDYIEFSSSDNGIEVNDKINILYNFLVESYGNFSYENEEGKFKHWITDEKRITFASFDDPIIAWWNIEESE